MKLRRFLAMMLTLTLLLTTINISGFAAVDEAFQGMINLKEDSNWQGSVFGDVGGQDKIVKENFEITENQDDTVMIKTANNRGKLAGESEGIAYYFREAPTDVNFTISATVHVDTWTANNQVSFGIMLRDEVLINEHTGNVNFGSYVAVGAVGQEMRAFYKDNTTGSGIKVDYDPFANVVQPTVGRTYDLSIQKMGDLLILSVDGETEIINTTTYQGENNYVGLFASRNTTVTFSNIELNIEGQIELGDWKDSFFGDNGGDAVILDPNNYGFTQNPDGSMTIKVANNRGKIAGETEGIAYYFKEIPADVNFEIKTRAKVDAWTGNNQVAFGLMLRSNVLDYQNLGSFTGDYVAVGALDQVMKGFYKYAGSGIQKADHLFSDAINPAAGQEYDLSLQKSGDLYVLKVGDETQILQDYTGEINYAGLFVSRNATVTFSDFEIIVDNRKIEELNVDYSGMKTDYLVGESLDLSGLLITALYDDGSEALIDPSDVIVTGFNSSEVGSNRITINYSGVTVTIDLQIVPLTVSELSIKYLPAKTDYYKLDVFNPLGMVVLANYNNGYTIEEISSDDYTILINNQPSTLENPYVFTTEGEMTVVIEAANGVTTDFKVNVKAANLESLEIRQNPEVMQYFIGDELDLDGIVVYAKYDDGSEVRLTRDEFEVTGFDSTIASDIELTITHKGIEIKLTVNVKVKDSQGIEVTNYPKTTYFIGDSFDNSGLVVSEVFDNGDRTPVSGYQMDTSHFDSSQPGVYEILITYGDDTTTLRVTVREKVEYQWNKVIFGQSISSSRNFINERNDHIEIIALEGGGKVTGDHDGISFYYIELDAEEDNFTLSADIKVVDYAKPNHDGQESFGIMARDAIDGHLKSDVFSSNIAAIGGYSGGTRNPNGTQLFARTGVLGSDGEGGKGIKAVMLQEGRPTASITYPVQNYRLTLSKTNSGFTGKINDGAEAIIFEPEILKVQDGKMYVGFYSARLATIEVYNIELDVTAAATDAQKVEPPKEPVVPGVRFESLGRYSLENYNVMIDANVDGTVSVRQGSTTIVSNVAVNGGEILSIPTTITKNSTTNFSLTFIPDDTQLLTSYDVIVRNFTVDMRTYQEGGDIYVSPTGTPSGDGSRQNPLDLDTAIDFVMPGQRIVVLDGHYLRNKPLEIKKYNDGTADARKYLVAEEGTRPVIDFDQRSEGVIHSGHYWHVKGLDFARSAGNTKGYTVGGSYNIIELVTLYEHGDTGLQISRTDTTENDPAKWPSYNLILNSTSFNNSDPSQNNADGFAAKLTSGEGNIFDGCIAYNNIDDGWDLYAKVGTGAIGAVTIRNSIAYNNGFLKGQAPGAGDGNGFKLGGEGIHVPHVIENSVAFGNVADGFSSNSNPAVIVRGENIALNNTTNLNLYTYSNITPDFQLDGFVSFHYNNPRAVRDRLPASQEAQLRSDSNFLFDGSKSVNASGSELTTSHFSNLVMPEEINRLADGSIDWSFLVYDPTGSQTPILPEEPSNPTDPIEMPEGAITDGTVRPDAKMTREEVLTLIFKLVIKEDEGTKNTNTIFTDVDPNSWSAEAILYFLDHGLVNGYQDGSFRPKDQITRAEFITILANFIPVDAPAVSSRVLQDTNDSWAKESIERAVAAGWIQGYPDGTFRPNEAISRAEVIVIMNRVLGRVPSQSELQDAGFSDLPETHWAYEDILEATR
ncbi:bacterial Ig-like domain-containing protein [Alkaliphilus transvaalensis]|uniref:bacterial Ig-like domain-containing protein n=1 Tax=Alkaliphilus transvaalensis TaxID=114628 RepID=UPI000687B301|nr:bacterial Ig-like domain-containing protein [Alkaliphilus transvaalensis]